MDREYYHKRLRNYLALQGSKSLSTLTVYKSNLDLILTRFPEPESADLMQIQNFALTFTNDNTRKNICVLLRWLFNKCLNRNIQWHELPYPKKKKKAQPIYTHHEIMKVLNVITNPKHKAILALIIDSGLRVSESCSILLTDCSIDERSIVLRSTKGDNDRTIYPSQYVWQLLEDYINTWHTTPTRYLFEGQKNGIPYTEESIRGFLQAGCKKAGVEYKKTHAIRRYLITWSIENQVDITAVADKVGHKGINTIQKHYLQHSPAYLKSINSPLANAVPA